MVPDFMSQAPRPYILPSLTTARTASVSTCADPAGTTSRMTLQNQRFPTLLPARMSDHRARFRKIMFDRAEPAQILEIVDVDMPVVDLVAALPQKITDHVRHGPSAPAGGRNRDKIPCGSKLGIEIDVDCVNDLSPGVTDIHLRHFICSFLLSRPPQSNHTLPDFAGPRSEKVGTGFGSDCAPTTQGTHDLFAKPHTL